MIGNNEKNEKTKVCLNCGGKGYLIVDIDSITLEQVVVCPICKGKKNTSNQLLKSY